MSFPLTTLGQSVVGDCDLPTKALEKVLFLRMQADCDFARETTAILQRIEGFTPRLPRVSLVIREKSTNASFDNGVLIWMPKVFEIPQKDGSVAYATTQGLQTALAHEYGHAILNEAIKEHLDVEWGSVFSSLMDISLISYDNLVANQSSMAIRRAGGQLGANEEFMSMMALMPSYSELYADVVAIFANAGNLKAMQQAIYLEEGGGHRHRDFSSMPSSAAIAAEKDPHTSLSMTRYYLGTIIPQMQTDEQKRSFLLLLEAAIVESLKEDYLNPFDLNKARVEVVERLNQRLIQKIQGKLEVPGVTRSKS